MRGSHGLIQRSKEEKKERKKREISDIVNNFQTVHEMHKVTDEKPSRCKVNAAKKPLSRIVLQTTLDHFLKCDL